MSSNMNIFRPGFKPDGNHELPIVKAPKKKSADATEQSGTPAKVRRVEK